MCSKVLVVPVVSRGDGDGVGVAGALRGAENGARGERGEPASARALRTSVGPKGRVGVEAAASVNGGTMARNAGAAGLTSLASPD